jgi:radical SAM-linked protein
MTKYYANFYKKEAMVYISHLDLMMLMRRAIRRADLPYVLTEGFTPRVKISMPKALKLGVESGDEEIFFWLRNELDELEVKNRLNGQLPEGIKILKAGKYDKAKESEREGRTR